MEVICLEAENFYALIDRVIKNGNSYEARIEKGKETFDILFTTNSKVLS